MGKIAEGVVVGAVTLGLAGGLSGCSSEVNLDQPGYDEGFIKTTVEKASAYWTAKGIGVSGVKATVLQGSATFNCGADTFTSESDDIAICNKDIIVPAQAVNTMRTNHAENYYGAMVGILNHEVGHEVIKQDTELMDNAPADPTPRDLFEERLATCLSGLAIWDRPDRAHVTVGASQAFLRAGDKEHYGNQITAYNWAFSQMDADPQKVVDPVKCVNIPAA